MAPDSFSEPLPSRFVVGIDLGTTNSAVCYVDTRETTWQVRVLEIPQLTAAVQIEARDTLPSFHYQPPAGEVESGALRLPWSVKNPQQAVGFYARDAGGQAAGRMIGSAKSWLCHGGVDRTADILPWHAAPDVEKLSPVEASARYLSHLRCAWNHAHRQDPLESQEIVLTLPASFDEVARELTVTAAARAGLPKVVLIEEPQAAFYAWIYKHADRWDQLISAGQKILVCDIGGGTTDFTLIRVRQGEGGKVQFHRVAVGDHLILGGDNFDLALAQHLEGKLTSGGKLEPRQWDLLIRLSRQAKEEMLGENPRETISVTLPGAGARLIGGGMSTHLSRAEVRELLVDGFMPTVALTDKPAPRRSGFQEFGLPYASDSAITRYLAAFLVNHREVALDEIVVPTGVDPARPDVLLFNGGVFESPLLKNRLIETLTAWFPAGGWRPTVLENDRLDLAVARGAAYYGMVRRGAGVKIAAGLARTYYIGVDSAIAPALCLLPGSAEPGQEIKLAGRVFDLVVSEPAEFPLYVSSTRLADRPGEQFPYDPEQMTALPPIRTALKTRTRRERGTAPVELHAKLTEIGTLDLWCSEVGGDRSWRLQFDIRSATETDREAHEAGAESEGFLDEQSWHACQQSLEMVFGAEGKSSPDNLMSELTAALGMERNEWPTSLLRRIWEALIEREAGRRKSPQHEARWLNLLGFALRPGYGLAVDDWRVAETWRTVQGKLAYSASSSRTESLILWRRIAGGFTAGQQKAIAEPLLTTLRALHKRQTSGNKGADPAPSPHESLEVLRLLGALELLPVEVKLDAGKMLLELLPKRKLDSLRPALAWALARLGARQPVSGPLSAVIPASAAGQWSRRIMELETSDASILFALVQLGRRTNDRYRDLPPAEREEIINWLSARGAPAHALELVRVGGQLDREEQSRVFGDSLPKGLRIR